MDKLVKGTILKDNLFGMEWEVVNPEKLVVKGVDNGKIITIETEKLNNFSIVFIPKTIEDNKNETKKNINFALNKDGIIINQDTNEPVCNQGDLKFSRISTLCKDLGFIIVGYSKNVSYWRSVCVAYRYWFEKDKFELMEDGYLFDAFKLKTKNYYVATETITGTYGDYREAYFYLYDKKFNLLAKTPFSCVAKTPIIISDKGGKVLAYTLTTSRIGAFSSSDAKVVFLEISKSGVKVLNPNGNLSLSLGGECDTRKKNKICVASKKKGSKFCIYNGKYVGIYNLDDFSLIENFEVKTNLGFEFVDITNISIEDFSITKNAISITFKGENAITSTYSTLKIKKTSDRGMIQSVA